jgi:3-oxoadipate enol-lactonase
VDDLLAVLDGVRVERGHVAGVSLGGLVGLVAAHRRPDRVESLVAMCRAARFSRDTWVDRARPVRADAIAPIVPMVMDRWFSRDFQEDRRDVLSRYRDMFASTDAAGYAHAADVLASADVIDRLPAIEVPALVISGEADTANPIPDQELIVRTVRGARYEIVPGAAHLAPVARPEVVARLVADHPRAAVGVLSRVSVSGSGRRVAEDELRRQRRPPGVLPLLDQGDQSASRFITDEPEWRTDGGQRR